MSVYSMFQRRENHVLKEAALKVKNMLPIEATVKRKKYVPYLEHVQYSFLLE